MIYYDKFNHMAFIRLQTSHVLIGVKLSCTCLRNPPLLKTNKYNIKKTNRFFDLSLIIFYIVKYVHLFLLQDRYPHVKRGDYAILNENHLTFFRDLLGDNRVLNEPSDCEGYNVDWIRNVRGSSPCTFLISLITLYHNISFFALFLLYIFFFI